MATRKWVGNEKDGYCIFKSKRKKLPWTGEIWRNGRVIAKVADKTQKEAVAHVKRYLR